MLVLNEELQKAGKPILVSFSRINYSLSGAISALLTTKGDVVELFKTCNNIPIQMVKIVDWAVISMEILEWWHYLKIYGMSLEKYLGDRKIEFFKREIEFLIGIKLKTNLG